MRRLTIGTRHPIQPLAGADYLAEGQLELVEGLVHAIETGQPD